MKIYLAGAETLNNFLGQVVNNCNYSLFTLFPFIMKKMFPKRSTFLINTSMVKSMFDIPFYITKHTKAVIQDSGLFTLIFGGYKQTIEKKMLNTYYEHFINNTLKYAKKKNYYIVEMDTQKIIGALATWNYRKNIEKDLKGYNIINVIHNEDGKKGVDKLIEYSNYIALSIPEMKKTGKRKYIIPLANYIKNKKPDIKIHLLGTTDLKLIKQLKFCESCDSTSHLTAKRFGRITNRHIDNITTKKVIKLIGKEKYNLVRKYNNETNTNALILSIYNTKNIMLKNGLEI